MVNSDVVTFEAVCRGSLNWRVSIDGEDDHVPFASRETCIVAARARARGHHLDHTVTTEVWAPAFGGKRECIIRFMTPPALEALLRDPLPSMDLREACDQYGSHFPCAWPRWTAMLVLSRRPVQAIKVGHDIEVRVFRCANGLVRFGIAAPRDVLILRGELLSRPAPQLPPRTSPPRKSCALRRTPRR